MCTAVCTRAVVAAAADVAELSNVRFHDIESTLILLKDSATDNERRERDKPDSNLAKLQLIFDTK